jgi:hypothetical protein
LKGFDVLKVPLLNDKGESAWPSRFTTEKINQIKARSGPLKFNSQMLLIPPQTNNLFFDTSLINLYDADMEFFQSNESNVYSLLGKKLVFGGAAWDPALGKTGGDKSVITAVFKDNTGNCYIHDIKYLGSQSLENSAHLQCEEVLDFMIKNKLFNIVVETNGIGAFLSEILKNTAKSRNYPIFIKKLTQTQNKNERIIGCLQPILYSSYFYLKSDLVNTQLIQEMDEFRLESQNNRDDTMDAISMCLSSNFGILKRRTNLSHFEASKIYKAKTNFSI